MQLELAFVAQRNKSGIFEPAITHYLDRIAPYAEIKSTAFRSEDALLTSVTRQKGRTTPAVVLLDSRGEAFSSKALATWIGKRRDAGQQAIIFGVGPADGWSNSALQQAQTVLSLGVMTLPHEMARLILAEQIYRAFTILAGHPYHTGH